MLSDYLQKKKIITSVYSEKNRMESASRTPSSGSTRLFRIKSTLKFILLLGLIFGLLNVSNAQVAINQVDNFNDGTTQGWVTGKLNDTIITNQANQLQVRAIGGAGAFGKLLVFNETTWSGDYIGQGITSIKLKMSNPYNPLFKSLRMRLAIGNNRAPGPPSAKVGTWFVSSSPVTITPATGEIEAVFSIKSEDLTLAQGADSYTSVLSNVAALRITASTSSTNPRGDDNTIATILIDDITACGCIGTPYEETINGDLSGVFSAPTFIELNGGTVDTVTSCQQGNPRDIDYFSFEVPQDSVLSGIVLTNYDAALNNNAFIGLQAGNAFTVDANNAAASNLLGGLTYGEAHEGMNILSIMGQLSGSQGFTSPLAAGRYTIWLNQTGEQSCASFQLQMSPAIVDADLSDNRLNPTVISFSSNMDTVSNCFQNSDVDYFTFEVPKDSVLTGIQLINYQVADANNQAFIGIQKGSAFTEPATGTNVANLLGGLVFGTAHLNSNILPTMGTLNGSQGFTTALPAGSYTIWLNQTGDESCATLQFQFANVDLSNDRLNPTIITFSETLDTVSNCVQGSPRDIDYFAFNVPPNAVLSELILKNYEVETSSNQAFIGIQSGTTLTVDANNATAGDLLGGLTYGTSHIGTNILPSMATLSGGQGFTIPLAAGNYTIWLNQTGPVSCATFQFNLTSIDCTDTLSFTNESFITDTVSAGTYVATNTIQTSGNLIIGANSSVVFQAGNAIQLNNGFHAVAGSNFHALIGSSNLNQLMDCPPAIKAPINQKVTNQEVLLTEPKSLKIPLRIYPNPFYQSTTIEYQLYQPEKISISIYTLSGRLMKTLAQHELQDKGHYKYDFSQENLGSGIYLLSLRTEREQLIQKMVVLK